MKLMITLKPEDASGLGGELLETLGMQRSNHDPKRFTKDLAVTELLDKFEKAVDDEGVSLREEDKVQAAAGSRLRNRRRRRGLRPTDFLLYEDNSMYALPYVEPLTDRGIRPLKVSLMTDSTVVLTPINASAKVKACGADCGCSCGAEKAEAMSDALVPVMPEQQMMEPVPSEPVGPPALADILSELLAFTRALYEVEHSFHWQSRGPQSYSDHQLFSRLYEATFADLDPLAEKLLGLTGDQGAVSALRQSQMTAQFIADLHPSDEPGALTSSALVLEQAFIDVVRGALEVCAEQMTDGLENFLQGLADKHEGHVYLLKQSVA